MKKEKVIFAWSGGKDSALCLHKVLESGRYEVACLLTTVNGYYGRVSMHGVRENLVDRQAECLGIPLEKVTVSRQSSNAEYEKKMEAVLLKYKALGVEQAVFGDIFLEDLRAWRENNLARIGMRGVFPLWKIDTRELVEEFITLGFKSITCCVNAAFLGEEMVGRVIDRDFVRSLPSGVDPCGENGEFLSFGFEGPVFRRPIPFKTGGKIFKPIEVELSRNCPLSQDPMPREAPSGGFWFCDLLEVAPVIDPREDLSE